MFRLGRTARLGPGGSPRLFGFVNKVALGLRSRGGLQFRAIALAAPSAPSALPSTATVEQLTARIGVVECSPGVAFRIEVQVADWGEPAGGIRRRFRAERRF
jgi:hypothetical protein